MPVTYDQIPEEPALYLSRRPFIPLEDVTLIFGPGAIGKGRMVASWVAAVTLGDPVGMDGDTEDPGDVIMITPEDRPGRDMVPRLTAAGADLAWVHDMTRLDGGGRFKLSATPREPGHLAYLRGKVQELADEGGNPRMVVIDPITKVIGWGNISTKPGANYLTEQLQDFAEDTGLAVIAVGHTTKSGVLEGSAGMMQGPRVVYRVSADPGNDAMRVLSVEKANNLPPTEDLRFTIIGENGVVRVEWLDRAKIEQRRVERRNSWLDRLATRRATKAMRATPGAYEARCTVNGQPFDLGSGLTLQAAQAACQGLAGTTPLSWQRKGQDWTARSDRATFALKAG